MTNFEMINLLRGPLEQVIAAGIRLADVKYAGLYADFIRLRSQGAKVTYAVAMLAQRYGICERKAYELLRRLGSDCTACAAQMGGGKKPSDKNLPIFAAQNQPRKPQ